MLRSVRPSFHCPRRLLIDQKGHFDRSPNKVTQAFLKRLRAVLVRSHTVREYFLEA
jgi:hypothetical protein